MKVMPGKFAYYGRSKVWNKKVLWNSPGNEIIFPRCKTLIYCFKRMLYLFYCLYHKKYIATKQTNLCFCNAQGKTVSSNISFFKTSDSTKYTPPPSENMGEESELRDVTYIIKCFPTSDFQGDHWRICTEYGFGIHIVLLENIRLIGLSSE